MAIDFKDRVAVVTGAGSGLGRCYALELAKRGAKVVVNDLGGSKEGVGSSSTAADQVVAEIKALGGEAVPNYDNIAEAAGGQNLFDTAVKAFGKVDILINNAGIIRDKSFLKMDEASWDAVLAVHLKGAYCATKPIFEHMKNNNYGRIVMTTSGAGLFGAFGQSNYSAAKLGIVGLANTLKIEGAKSNIKVNVVSPVAATRMTEGIGDPAARASLAPENVAAATLFMASEQCQDSGMIINAFAGKFVRSAILTGQVVRTDNATPEFVAENWAKITSLEDANYYAQMGEFVAATK